MTQQNGKVKTKVSLKLVQALELRAAGASYRKIAEVLGVSRASAWRIVTRGLDELAEESKAMAERIRELELLRMDKLRLALWPKRGDPAVANALVRISERTARLVGLDAPDRHEVTADVQTQQTTTAPDLTGLNDEDLQQLDRIHRKMRKEG